MSYKHQIIILFFLLVSSYSFSATTQPDENSLDCTKHQEVHQVTDVFNEKVIMMTRDFEKKLI